MKKLVHEKEKAIALRKKGYSYNEILQKVPVAKSSLSQWLKDLPLTKREKVVLRNRTDTRITQGRIRAAAAHRDNRLKKEVMYLHTARVEFDTYVTNHLFHTGIALYWAEGAKRNELFQFMNSDSEMIETVLCWLESFTDYKRSDLGYRLYVHKPYAHEGCEKWWAEQLGVSTSNFKKTIYKPSGLGVKKRPNYRGCLRVEVPKSSFLLKKMKFWQKMLVEYYKKQ